MPGRITRIGDLWLGAGHEYDLKLPSDQPPVLGIERELRQRRSRFPTLDAFRGREQTFTAHLIARKRATVARMRADVARYLDPTRGPYRVWATHDFHGVGIYRDVDVLAANPSPGKVNMVDLQLQATDPRWFQHQESVVGGVAGSHAGTALNAGDTLVYPKVIFCQQDAPYGHLIYRRRIAITDHSLRGVANYYVRFQLDLTGQGMEGATANNFVVFFRGRSIPFLWVED